MRVIFIFFIACLAFSACKQKEKPLSIDEMKKITWDMMKADEWSNNLAAKDSISRKRNDNIRLYKQVFAIHGVTKEKFYMSYAYYESHPAEMKVLIDSIDAFSNREREKLFENHGQAKH